MSDQPDLAAAANRYGLSEGAAQALFDALVSAGGRMAQFSHPDLGGMGQWSGGMTQIGDMFNDGLKARVNAFCTDLSAAAAAFRLPSGTPGQWQSQGDGTRPASTWANPPGSWWPAHLGAPSSAGSQNDMSYACFPDQHRLAISRKGTVTLYDTGDHRLSGFSQQQSSGQDVSFSGQYGSVALNSLTVVDW